MTYNANLTFCFYSRLPNINCTASWYILPEMIQNHSAFRIHYAYLIELFSIVFSKSFKLKVILLQTQLLQWKYFPLLNAIKRKLKSSLILSLDNQTIVPGISQVQLSSSMLSIYQFLPTDLTNWIKLYILDLTPFSQVKAPQSFH